MARTPGSLRIPMNIEPRASAPLDARQIVPALADLTTAGTFPYPYEGMLVYVTAEQKFYVYKGGVITSSANWQEIGAGGAETMFVATDSLFSKVEGGTTQLSALTFVKHAYDTTSGISESDLIPNISLVIDTNNTLVIYTGKNQQNKYVFKTILIGIKITYDSVNDRNVINLTGDWFFGDDIIPLGSSVHSLGASSNKFWRAYVEEVISSSLQIMDEWGSESYKKVALEFNSRGFPEFRIRGYDESTQDDYD